MQKKHLSFFVEAPRKASKPEPRFMGDYVDNESHRPVDETLDRVGLKLSRFS